MESPIALTCMISIKWIRNLYLHMVWIQNILPPVVEDSIFAAGGFGQMLKPPDMMFADIPITPFAGRDSSNLSFEVWKVFQPVVTFTGDGTWVVPIIIPLAVRRE